MKPSPSSDHDEQDRKIIELLKDLGTLKPAYPPELLAARRAAFLAQVQRLRAVRIGEGVAAEDREILRLLGNLKSAQAEYPPDLLAARRSALLRQMESPRPSSFLDELRVSLQRIFQYNPTIPTLPSTGFLRLSLVIASIVAAVYIGSLFLSRGERLSLLSPSQGAEGSTPLPTSAGEVSIIICKPDEQTPPCLLGELTASQDLANQGNGEARPAVSKDARSNPNGIHRAAYVNDGRGGESWVSNSNDSWIKIDLGKMTTINTVSLRKGNLGPSSDNNPGQFVIAVALSDVYADGDSRNDYVEYTQVFHSEQTGFSGSVSHEETIQTHFPPVKARFVKVTFEQAGTAIEEVGVFLVKPPVIVEQATGTPQDDQPTMTFTPVLTGTLSTLYTATSTPTGVQQATHTAISTLTNTIPPAASHTPTPLATNTLPAPETATPIPTEILPSDTPIPPPTVVLPTDTPPVIEPSPASIDPIVVTGNDQNVTFTCNGNAAEIRGHANTVTLLGSCSSITVTGNGNRVFWESGAPVITNRGKDNIIQQL